MGEAQARALLALSLEPQRVADLGISTPGDPRRANLSATLRNLRARQLAQKCHHAWALAHGYHVDEALDAAFEVLHGRRNVETR